MTLYTLIGTPYCGLEVTDPVGMVKLMIHLTWNAKLTDAMFVGKKTQIQDWALVFRSIACLAKSAPTVLWKCPGNLWSKQLPAWIARRGLREYDAQVA